MRALVKLLLLLPAGCSGGPLKELPFLEAPPAARDDAEPATLVGAWASVQARGPGSGSLRRILMVFDAEGTFRAAAFGERKTSTLAGTYRSLDGAVELELGDDGRRVWAAELESDTLVLREGEGEIRLARLR